MTKRLIKKFKAIQNASAFVFGLILFCSIIFASPHFANAQKAQGADCNPTVLQMPAKGWMNLSEQEVDLIIESGKMLANPENGETVQVRFDDGAKPAVKLAQPELIPSTNTKNKLKPNKQIIAPKSVPASAERWVMEEYKSLNENVGVNKRDNNGCDQKYVAGPQGGANLGLSYRMPLSPECNVTTPLQEETKQRKKVLDEALQNQD